MIRKLWDRLLDLLYPPRCMLCRRFLEPEEKPVCQRCLDALPELDGPAPQISGADACAVTFFYDGTLRDCFLRFKFEGRSWYAEQLGTWLAVTVRDRLAGQFEIITWAPVSHKRLRERGYDQSELLCRVLSRELGIEAAALLEKCTDNRAQSSLHDAQARFANTKGVYHAAAPGRIRGKRILLVDDIVTTGATLSECVRVLKQAGAESVVCAALATPPNT